MPIFAILVILGVLAFLCLPDNLVEEANKKLNREQQSGLGTKDQAN